MTMYENDESNWDVLCDDCQSYRDEIGRERWEKYWGGLL